MLKTTQKLSKAKVEFKRIVALLVVLCMVAPPFPVFANMNAQAEIEAEYASVYAEEDADESVDISEYEPEELHEEESEEKYIESEEVDETDEPELEAESESEIEIDNNFLADLVEAASEHILEALAPLTSNLTLQQLIAVATPVATRDALVNAINAVPANGEGIFSLTQNISGTATINIIEGRRITIVGNNVNSPAIYALPGTARHFTVNHTDSVLTLRNITLDGEWTPGMTTNRGGVAVTAGTLILGEGSSITRTRRGTAVGSAIDLSGVNARLVINGGGIHGNANDGGSGASSIRIAGGAQATMTSGRIWNSTSPDGGGVHITGANSRFEMQGGSIENNTATQGGGVAVASGGNFIMENGSIRANQSTAASARGGGVHVTGANSRFTMRGGSIEDNTLTGATSFGGGVSALDGGQIILESGTIRNNQAASGGGVSVAGAGSHLSMIGGTIEGNRANGTGVHQGGGGVWLADIDNAMVATGGIIRNNIAARNGGGIFTMRFSSLPTLANPAYNNLQIGSGVTFTGNRAVESSQPPLNPGFLINIPARPQTSVPLFTSVLNNYDINYHRNGFTVHTHAELLAEVARIPANSEAVINLSGDISGTSTVTIGDGRDILVRSLNPQVPATYALPGTARHFTVNNAQAQLTVENMILDGEWTAGITTNRAGVVVSAGTFILGEGSSITRTRRGTAVGSAVELSGANSRLTINGGEIHGNANDGGFGAASIRIAGGAQATMASGRIWSNIGPEGAGVHVTGAISRFEMQGGFIENNTAAQGAGVSIASGGNFIMENGSIRANQSAAASARGSGVHVTDANSRFTMRGGTIEDNTLTGATSFGGGVSAVAGGQIRLESGTIRNNQAASGGGVAIAGANSQILMMGGTIEGNRANGVGVHQGGGGVWLADIDNAMVATGGIIRNNIAARNGGGIFTMRFSSIPTLANPAYNNLQIGSSVTFTGNRAVESSQPPLNPSYLTNIAARPQTSVPLITSVLNNYDINYHRNGFTVHTHAELLAEVARIPVSSEAVINLSGDISGASTVTIGGGREILVRALNQQTPVTYALPGTARHFTVNQAQAKLTLENVILDGEWTTAITTNRGGVDVSAGTLVLGEGSAITRTRRGTAIGSAVELNGANSRLTIKGGEIHGNGTGSANGVSGVRVAGGAQATMISGRIWNNTSPDGGGLFVTGANSRFEMQGGYIENNTATNRGGGIFVNIDASADILGGTIRGNRSTNDGGGIFTERFSHSTILPPGAYGNIRTGSTVVFANNTAGTSAVPPQNTAQIVPQLQFARTSINNHILNNYDINFRATNETPTVQVATHAALSTAINAAVPGVTTRIEITGDITGGALTIAGGRDIILVGTPISGITFTCTATAGTRHFILNHADSRLTLENITLDGAWQSGTVNRGGVDITAGTLVLGRGSVITRARWSSATISPGVNLNGINSRLIIDGGVIHNNEQANAAGTAGVRAAAGAQVTVVDGAIRDNSVGAGVIITGANTLFTMRGGVIENHTVTGAANRGAGVRVETGATFIMEGGRIRNNEALAGGGVAITGVGGRFTMSGGYIEGNRAVGVGTHDGGAGIWVEDIDNAIAITRGTIRNNIATNDGGAIFTMRFSYEPTILGRAYNNINVGSAAVFTGNRAVTSSQPPLNPAALPNIATLAQTSVAGVTHPLNNFDINYRRGITVTTHAELVAAINGLPANASATINLANDITGTAAITINNGRQVTLRPVNAATPVTYTNESAWHFIIDHADSRLILESVILDGAWVTGTVNRGGVEVPAGTLVLGAGSAITRARRGAANIGAAVHLTTANSRLIIDGGEIHGNTSASTSGTAGVRIAGGAQATMINGTIRGNWNSVDGVNAGAGVFVTGADSLFTMQGGVIENNTLTGVSTRGAGVNVAATGRFIFENGTIRNNTAHLGGGIAVHGANSELTMTGGYIEGNTAVTTAANQGGGGIFVTAASTASITGGAFRNNVSGNDGGAIFTERFANMNIIPSNAYDNLRITGNVTFTGNTAATLSTPPQNANVLTHIANAGTILNNYHVNFRTDRTTVSTHAALVTAINAMPVNSSAVIYLSGNITGNTAIAIDNGRQVTLRPLDADSTVTYTTTGGSATNIVRHFGIHHADSRLTLENVILDGTWASGAAQRGGVAVTAGTFVLGEGSSITRARVNTDAQGSAVNLTGATSRLIIDGGEIHGNIASNAGGVAGVRAVNGAQITMTRGAIRNNENAANSTTAGGVFISGTGSQFIMQNGVIENHILTGAATRGAGVRVEAGARFEMQNGAVRGNQAGSDGGGILVVGANSRFEMRGGQLEDNVAGQRGGGLFIDINSSADIVAGTIRRNTSGHDGGGIFTERFVYSSHLVPSAYGNLQTGPGVIFTQNTAQFSSLPPQNAALVVPRIRFAQTSIHSHILNNFDINFRVIGETVTDTPVHVVNSHAELISAIAAATPGVATRIELASNITGGNAAVLIDGGRDIIITSAASPDAPFTYTQTNAQRHFTVSGLHSSLTLENVTLTGAWFFGNTNRGGIDVPSGTLVLGPGSTITRTFWNTANIGSAVNLSSAQSRLIINGGEVVENFAENASGVAGIRAANGAQVTMINGAIRGNRNSQNGLAAGAGVDIAGAGSRFTMQNGVIESNILTGTGTLGGGVRMRNSAEFHFSGGTIRNNEAARGGGIAAIALGRIVMTGGYIEGNRAVGTGTHEGGGGIFLDDNPLALTITDGTIRNNIAMRDGGAIFTMDAIYEEIIPTHYLRYQNIAINRNVIFYGNRAFMSSQPPLNPEVLPGIPHMAQTSVSGETHLLNNYDINYRFGGNISFERHNDDFTVLATIAKVNAQNSLADWGSLRPGGQIVLDITRARGMTYTRTSGSALGSGAYVYEVRMYLSRTLDTPREEWVLIRRQTTHEICANGCGGMWCTGQARPAASGNLGASDPIPFAVPSAAGGQYVHLAWRGRIAMSHHTATANNAQPFVDAIWYPTSTAWTEWTILSSGLRFINGAITGQTVDENNAALPGVSVILRDETGLIVGELTSDIEGRFALDNLDDGQYRVTFTHPGRYTVEQIVRVNDGVATDIGQVVMLPTGRIDGLVIGKDNAPLSGVSVAVRNVTETVTRNEVTDSTGRFVARHLPDGEYILEFNRWGLITEVRTVTIQNGEVVEITVVMQRVEYTITFMNQGKVHATQTVLHGDAAVQPNPPEQRVGWNFTGWLTAEGETWNFETPITDNLTLNAGWSRQVFSVRYECSIGAEYHVVANVEFESEHRVRTLSEAGISVPAGHYFAGWQMGAELLQSGDAFAMPANNVVLVAQWGRVTHTITFMNQGNVHTTQLVLHGDAAVQPDVPEQRVGWNFVGWFTAEGEAWNFETPIADNLTLNAGWSRQAFSVRYECSMGAEYHMVAYVTFEAEHSVLTIEATGISVPAGRYFAGWQMGENLLQPGDTFTMPARDVVLVAQWTQAADNLIVANNPAFSPYPYGQTPSGWHAPGEQVTVRPGTVDGYRFIGWNVEGVTNYTIENGELTFIMPSAQTTSPSVPVGETFTDSTGIVWRVLHEDAEGRQLIITEHVHGPGTRYHSSNTFVQLHNAEIRTVLNTWYSNNISSALHARAIPFTPTQLRSTQIAPGTWNVNEIDTTHHARPGTGTANANGNNALFLLSISEVNTHFENANDARIGRCSAGTARLWWLRSPAHSIGVGQNMAGVGVTGNRAATMATLTFSGTPASGAHGFRPAMWINPQGIVPDGGTASTVRATAQWEEDTHTVTFMDRGVIHDEQVVAHGDVAVEPADPVRGNGAVFNGRWYNVATGELWNFETPITENLTLETRDTGWMYRPNDGGWWYWCGREWHLVGRPDDGGSWWWCGRNWWFWNGGNWVNVGTPPSGGWWWCGRNWWFWNGGGWQNAGNPPSGGGWWWCGRNWWFWNGGSWVNVGAPPSGSWWWCGRYWWLWNGGSWVNAGRPGNGGWVYLPGDGGWWYWCGEDWHLVGRPDDNGWVYRPGDGWWLWCDDSEELIHVGQPGRDGWVYIPGHGWWRRCPNRNVWVNIGRPDNNGWVYRPGGGGWWHWCYDRGYWINIGRPGQDGWTYVPGSGWWRRCPNSDRWFFVGTPGPGGWVYRPGGGGGWWHWCSDRGYWINVGRPCDNGWVYIPDSGWWIWCDDSEELVHVGRPCEDGWVYRPDSGWWHWCRDRGYWVNAGRPDGNGWIYLPGHGWWRRCPNRNVWVNIGRPGNNGWIYRPGGGGGWWHWCRDRGYWVNVGRPCDNGWIYLPDSGWWIWCDDSEELVYVGRPCEDGWIYRPDSGWWHWCRDRGYWVNAGRPDGNGWIYLPGHGWWRRCPNRNVWVNIGRPGNNGWIYRPGGGGGWWHWCNDRGYWINVGRPCDNGWIYLPDSGWWIWCDDSEELVHVGRPCEDGWVYRPGSGWWHWCRDRGHWLNPGWPCDNGWIYLPGHGWWRRCPNRNVWVNIGRPGSGGWWRWCPEGENWIFEDRPNVGWVFRPGGGGWWNWCRDRGYWVNVGTPCEDGWIYRPDDGGWWHWCDDRGYWWRVGRPGDGGWQWVGRPGPGEAGDCGWLYVDGDCPDGGWWYHDRDNDEWWYVGRPETFNPRPTPTPVPTATPTPTPVPTVTPTPTPEPTVTPTPTPLPTAIPTPTPEPTVTPTPTPLPTATPTPTPEPTVTPIPTPVPTATPTPTPTPLPTATPTPTPEPTVTPIPTPVPTATPTPTPLPTATPTPTPIPTGTPTPIPTPVPPTGGGGGGGGGGTPPTPVPTPTPTTPGASLPPGLIIPMSQWHAAYLVGYEDGEIRPQRPVSRAEVATIFFRLISDEYRVAVWRQDNPFPDVNINDWFNNGVSTMVNAGLMRGDDWHLFRPNDFITRAEFAAVASRFTEMVSTGTPMFEDVAGHWAENYINIAAEMGWFQGYEDGEFRPNNLITRAETATIVNRMLNRVLGSTEDLLPNMVRWPDNSNPNAWYYLAMQQATNSADYERRENGINIRWTAMWPHFDFTILERPHSRAEDVFPARAIWFQLK